MPARKAVTRTQVFADLWALANAPRLVRVRTKILVHVPSSGGTKCPCCDSPHARIEEEQDDLDLLIEATGKRRRWLRHQSADTAAYDRLAAKADLTLDVPLRCSPSTKEIILDEQTPVILLSGGARSSKTTTMLLWGFRQWMLRGGLSVVAWFLAVTRQSTQILLDKWVRGDGSAPAVCPRELILSLPKSVVTPGAAITMIDGTRIELRHTATDGKNLAGKTLAFGCWTEASLTRNPTNWAQIRGRVLSTGGQIAMDSVPEPGHWLRHAVVEPAQEEETNARDAASKGEAFRRTNRVCQLSTKDNPWVDPVLVAEFHQSLLLLDERIAARQAGGEWIGDTNMVFADYWDASAHTFEYEGWDLAYLGLDDATKQASLRWFPKPHDWLVGVDINADPHSALIGKIGVPKGADPRDCDKWIAVFFDVLQRRGLDSEEAAEELNKIHKGLFKGAGILIDAEATHRSNAGGALNQAHGIIPARAYEDAGFDVRAPDRWPDGKRNPRNPPRFDSAIMGRRLMREKKFLVNRFRCRALVRALREQPADKDGITPLKRSNTALDRDVTSLIDTMRYFCWPFFGRAIPNPAKMAASGNVIPFGGPTPYGQ